GEPRQAPQPGARTRPRRREPAEYAGHPPVAGDAQSGPGEQPEQPADHRGGRPIAGTPAAWRAGPAPSPGAGRRPGTAAGAAARAPPSGRRRATACRTPYATAAALPTGPVTRARPSPASADTCSVSSATSADP